VEPDRDNIATFVEVIRQNSLAGAARHLGLPKSTVSRRLSRLEEQLDTKLVHRDGRQVSATSEGMQFFDSVVDAIDALESAVAAIEQSSTEPRGTIRVTTPSDLGRMVLSAPLARFLDRYPEIALDLVLTNRFVDLVQERVDLAVRAGPVTEPNLIARKLMPSALWLVAQPGEAIDCDDVSGLEAYPFVLYRKRGPEQVLRLERGDGDHAESVELRVSGRVNVDDYSVMADLVAEGQGIGLMPALHAEEGIRQGRLVRIFPDWVLPAMPIQLVYPTRQQPERVRLLIDFLIDALRV
jgi:DNA-binding transcriptional LysR family regulator